MADHERCTVGAEALPTTHLPKPSYTFREKPSIDSLDSSYTRPAADQSPAAENEYDPTSMHPFSPFYSYPTTRTSFEQQKSESKVNIAIYQHDLESGSRVAQSVDAPRYPQQGTVWQASQSQKSLCCQKNKDHRVFRDLSKKQRLLVKLLIAFCVIGAAVGLGIGIAKATGTGIWKNENSQSAIGGDHPH